MASSGGAVMRGQRQLVGSQQQPHLLSTAQCMVNTLSQGCGEKEPIWSAALTTGSLTMASRKKEKALTVVVSSASGSMLCYQNTTCPPPHHLLLLSISSSSSSSSSWVHVVLPEHNVFSPSGQLEAMLCYQNTTCPPARLKN
ncbi:hypothetical protein EYF80_006715 [Liparis tanakae]|uniref:Uncharacterized protein n=1 Tax=Liparis tanakae TaxID=230148 RepID=A0A4Z2J0A3_9TELE|nr:hypothetical protein EYF80_006715 [Liparis tanakae]